MEPQTIQALASTIPMAAAEDSVTAYSWKALAGSAIGHCMDGFDYVDSGLHARRHLSGSGDDQSAAIALLASIYVFEIIAIVFLVPELKGKELE
jgi:hypothetical protein